MKSNFKIKHQIIGHTSIVIFLIALSYILYTFVSIRILEEQERITLKNMFSQVTTQINNLDMRTKESTHLISYNPITHKYLTASSDAARQSHYKMLSTNIENIHTLDDMISDIWIIDNEGDSIHSSNSMVPFWISIKFKNYYDLNSDFFTKQRYLSTVLQAGPNEYYYAIANPIYDIFGAGPPFEKIGNALLICTLNPLNDILNKIQLHSNSLFFITNNTNQIIASNNSSYLNTSLSDITSLYNAPNIILNSESLSMPGWKLTSITSKSTLTSRLRTTQIFTLFITLIVIILIIIINQILFKQLVSPILSITHFIASRSLESSSDRLPLIYKNEFKVLEQGINNLLDKNENITSNLLAANSNIYELQLAHKQSQINTLKSQINPHFLYNTLECIRSISLAYGVKENVRITVCLGNILRYSLADSNLVTLSDEINCIKDYLDILNIRFMNKITYTIDIEPSLLDVSCPRMILQPIIENAIYHGCEQTSYAWHLNIYALLIDNVVHVSICDNGVGIESSHLDFINNCLQGNTPHIEQDHHTSIGLTNINSRLKLTYGSTYGVSLSSELDIGTTVTLTFPLL